GEAGGGGLTPRCSRGYHGLRGTPERSAGTLTECGWGGQAQRPERNGGTVAADRSLARGRGWERGTNARADQLRTCSSLYAGYQNPSGTGPSASGRHGPGADDGRRSEHAFAAEYRAERLLAAHHSCCHRTGTQTSRQG